MGAHAAIGSSIAADASGDADPNAYFIDGLFRPVQPGAEVNMTAIRGETGRLLANALQHGGVSASDKTYLASVVAARTGLTQAEAEQRVSQIVTQAQSAADTARKAAARLSLWIFITLLAGAFFGSYAATIGGRQRDHLYA